MSILKTSSQFFDPAKILKVYLFPGCFNPDNRRLCLSALNDGDKNTGRYKHNQTIGHSRYRHSRTIEHQGTAGYGYGQCTILDTCFYTDRYLLVKW